MLTVDSQRNHINIAIASRPQRCCVATSQVEGCVGTMVKCLRSSQKSTAAKAAKAENVVRASRKEILKIFIGG